MTMPTAGAWAPYAPYSKMPWNVRRVVPLHRRAGFAATLDELQRDLKAWSARIGQDLFDPPNVGGWPDGRAWLHTRGLIARANFAAALIAGPGCGRAALYG